jgi:hypothetical protein
VTPVSFLTFSVAEEGVYTEQLKVGSAAIDVSLQICQRESLASRFSSPRDQRVKG